MGLLLLMSLLRSELNAALSGVVLQGRVLRDILDLFTDVHSVIQMSYQRIRFSSLTRMLK